MAEEEHAMVLVETLRRLDCLQLTYVCACGTATRRKLYDKDFDITEPVVAPKTSKNGRSKA